MTDPLASPGMRTPLALAVLVLMGCSGQASSVRTDSGAAEDAGVADAGAGDSGAAQGTDAGSDAGATFSGDAGSKATVGGATVMHRSGKAKQRSAWRGPPGGRNRRPCRAAMCRTRDDGADDPGKLTSVRPRLL